MSGSAISFARGAPSLDIIDVDGLRASADRALAADPAGVFSYGTAWGYTPLREWIASELHQVEPENVLTTNGSLQADAFLFDLLVKPGDDVIVERPTYDRTLKSLISRGAKVHAIQVQSDGIDVEALATLLESGVRPKLAHIIPNYQNPAGVTLSLAKRERLVALAAEYEFTIFEDDPYRLVSFNGETLPTMLSLDSEGWVAHVSSFTKTICPGVRVGYIVGQRELLGPIRGLATDTYISPCMVSQAIVNDFARSGAIWESIKTVKSALQQRRDVLADTLAQKLPEADFLLPEGGYFMWAQLPDGADAEALQKAAADKGVQIVKGSDFIEDGGTSAFRLAYSAEPPERIEEGITILGDVYAQL